MQKQADSEKTRFSDNNIEEILHQFINVNLDRGLSVEESLELVKELLNLVTQDREHEWPDRVEESIRIANSN